MEKKLKGLFITSVLVPTAFHLINKYNFNKNSLNHILLQKENYFYNWRFGKINYTKKGEGQPLLLIHDLTVGSSGYEFSRITDELSKTHQVYTIDLLGYGLSDKPNMTYTNFLFAEMICDFIKTVIKRKTDIVVTGDSAPFIITATHNEPELFNRLVLINPESLYQLNMVPSKRTNLLRLIINTPIIGTYLYSLYCNRTKIEERFIQEYFYDAGKIKEKDIISYVEAAHTPDYSSKYSYSSHISRYNNMNILHSLKEINNSIFIIGGSNKKDNKDIIENYQYYNSSIEYILIPLTKHLPQLEKPKALIKQIEIFLD